MAQKQNPTKEGRVLWNSLVGASKEPNTLISHRTQYLIAAHSLPAELAAVVAELAFGAGGSDG